MLPTEPYINRKSLVYKNTVLCIKTQDVKITIFARLHTLPAVKATMKNYKKFESTTLCRKFTVQYENIIKGSKPKLKKYILRFRNSNGQFLILKNTELSSLFWGMTLHFCDTTTTGFYIISLI